MNLIINSNPKDDLNSLSGALAKRLTKHLGGATRTIRIYESSQHYFNYEYAEDWIKLVMESKRIILPVQMWNFTIPAALKDFFDKITKPKVVWKMGPNDSFIGLLSDRPVYIIMTSGLEYPPGHPQDFVVPYLKEFFAFMGIRNVKDFRVGRVSSSTKFIADGLYMEKTTQAMLQAFDLAPKL